MDLRDYRAEMDRIDSQLVELFQQRMAVSRDIALYKREAGLPILDVRREQEKLKTLCTDLDPQMQNYVSVLYSSLFELSRALQTQQTDSFTELSQRIDRALAQTPALFPKNASVAFRPQDPEAEAACQKLFRSPLPVPVQSLEALVSALETGLCDFGVVPMEHADTGSVKQVYDLLQTKGLTIVRAVRLRRQNTDTRFVCIARTLQIYPGADRTSFTLDVPHRPGALYRVLARFYALGINILKLESHALPDRDSEFRFYCDLDASIYDREFIRVLCELAASTPDFHYLGSYSEVL